MPHIVQEDKFQTEEKFKCKNKSLQILEENTGNFYRMMMMMAVSNYTSDYRELNRINWQIYWDYDSLQQ